MSEEDYRPIFITLTLHFCISTLHEIHFLCFRVWILYKCVHQETVHGVFSRTNYDRKDM